MNPVTAAPSPGRLYEILVPTMRRKDDKPIKLRYHRVWDAKVRAISGGLTVMPPAKGQWLCNEGNLFAERVIPVRFLATPEQARAVAEMTLDYYDQLAILCYVISTEVMLIHKDET